MFNSRDAKLYPNDGIIHQKINTLPHSIREYGCCLIAHTIGVVTATDMIRPETITDKNIIDIYNRGRDANLIDDTCFINSHDGICKIINTYFDTKSAFMYEGKHSKEWTMNKRGYILGAWHNHKHNFIHFVVMDGRGNKIENITFDSLRRIKYDNKYSATVMYKNPNSTRRMFMQ